MYGNVVVDVPADQQADSLRWLASSINSNEFEQKILRDAVMSMVASQYHSAVQAASIAQLMNPA